MIHSISFLWLISINKMFSISTLLQMAGFHFYGWVVIHCVYPTFLSISLLMGIWAAFHISAIINSAAINTGCMYIFELVFSFASEVYPGLELLDHMVVLFLVFGRNSTAFHSSCSNLHSHQQVQGFLFSSFSPTFVIHKLFEDRCSDMCLKIIMWARSSPAGPYQNPLWSMLL